MERNTVKEGLHAEGNRIKFRLQAGKPEKPCRAGQMKLISLHRVKSPEEPCLICKNINFPRSKNDNDEITFEMSCKCAAVFFIKRCRQLFLTR